METSNEFLSSGLLLAFALAAGRAASELGLPRVAAYLVVGILFSPGILGDKLGFHVGAWAESFTIGALGVIAYLIGGSMTTGQLRRMGKIMIGSALGESMGALLLVFAAILALLSLKTETTDLPLASAFAVLAISTAPAATLAVIHQYRTKGPVSDTLLGVVVLDDAVGVICFSLLLALVAGNSFVGGFMAAVIEIGGAFLLGAIAGWVLSRASLLFGESGFRLPLLLASILLVLGISHSLGLSLLLATMSLGFSTRHYTKASAGRLFDPVYSLEETIFLLFFTIAGTHFDFTLFQQHVDLILVYVIARIAGKITGSALGARVAGAPKSLVQWLGFGLVPQAGVAIGLALLLSHQDAYAQAGHMIVNVILGTTLLNELIGPLATQCALRRTGELQIKREKHRHEGF